MRHRFFPGLMMLGVIIILIIPGRASKEDRFADVDPDAGYAEAVSWAAEHGYINGYPDGRFGVNDPVTRAQMAVLFYRAAGSPDASGTTSFSDMQTAAYYANAVSWAADNGLITGYPDGRFGVDDPVTRQQTAAILWRWAGSPDVPGGDYRDESGVAPYAKAAVDWSRANGILAGRADGRFAPEESATRAELVSALYQYMNLTSDEVTEDDAMPKLQMEVNGQVFTASLLDNPTARAFLERLPMTVSMAELNGNEKYYNMSGSLPTDSQRPGTIRAGDLMLYGSDCLVLFYESFSSGYSYTRLGSLDDPAGLASALGEGSVDVTFRLA